jgi:cell division protein FtsB
MPTASATQGRNGRPTAKRPAATTTTRARRVSRASGGARLAAGVRWDRVGRAALLCVLVGLVYLYGSAGVRMLSTWRQSSHDNAAVATLQAEHTRLLSEHSTLSQPEALENEARKLGMMRHGEQPYVVTGLPGD